MQASSDLLPLSSSAPEEIVLDVAGLDSGTWPADGGGVANVRQRLR